jgi:hypothetical protein
MLSAAIDLWLLPATMFLDAFLPAPKPAPAIIIPLTPAAQRIRRRRKIVLPVHTSCTRRFLTN